jgi:hypothetical protein
LSSTEDTKGSGQLSGNGEKGQTGSGGSPGRRAGVARPAGARPAGGEVGDGTVCAATGPITPAPGKKEVVAARYVHNDRLIDALMAQALTALNTSPGARARYDAERARGTSPLP